jgi:hypothetical protein
MFKQAVMARGGKGVRNPNNLSVYFMKWAHPRDINEWAGRLLGLHSLIFLLCAAVFLMSEFRFDWIEQVLGRTLVRTNTYRPESGAIWEVSRRTQNARKTLEQIVSDQTASQQNIRGAESFSEVTGHILPGQGAMLAPEHFRKMYLTLPGEIAGQILSPHELLRIASKGNWHRVFFEKSETGITVYLLDAKNRVLKQLHISEGLLHHLQSLQTEYEGSLDDLVMFRNRIIPADIFLAALDELPAEVSERVMPNPEYFLGMPGRMTRIGLAEKPVSGFTDIGIEITQNGSIKVVRQKGYEWAVWQLQSHIRERQAQGAMQAYDPKPDMDMERESP